MTIKIISVLLAMPLFAALALPGLAEEITPTPTPTPTSAPTISPTPSPALGAGLVCVQTAVEKRENAIIAAFDVFSTSSKTALQTRRDALKAAWALTEKKARKAAIKKVWNDFTVTTRNSRRALNKTRAAVWKQYKKELKACRAQGAPTSDDYGSEGQESNL